MKQQRTQLGSRSGRPGNCTESAARRFWRGSKRAGYSAARASAGSLWLIARRLPRTPHAGAATKTSSIPATLSPAQRSRRKPLHRRNPQRTAYPLCLGGRTLPAPPPPTNFDFDIGLVLEPSGTRLSKGQFDGERIYSKYFDAPRFLTSTILAVVQNHLTQARDSAASQTETVFHNLAVSVLEIDDIREAC